MNYIILLGLSAYLFIKFDKAIFYIACFWMILNMLTGIGPISLLKIIGFVGIAVYILKKRPLEIKNYPPYWILFLYISIIIASDYFNERHTPTMLGFLSTNILLPFLYWQVLIRTERCETFIKYWVVWFFILSIYGLFEAITNSNPIVDWMLSDSNKAMFNGYFSEISTGFRYGFKRIQSITLWRDSMGTNCALLWGFLYYILFYYPEEVKSGLLKKSMTLLLFILPVMVLLTGSRACYVVMAVCMLPVFFKFTPSRFLFLFLIISVVGIIGYDYLANIFNSFIDTESAGGSSLLMRQIQLEAVLETVKQSPWLGNGFGSWDEYSFVAEDLLGAESVWFQLILKMGFSGMIVYAIFWAIMIYFIIKQKIPYMIFFVIAYLAGKTFSSLPGSDDSMVIMFIALAFNIFQRNSSLEIEESQKVYK